jgi:ABC-type uncharacterized transport system auxiliary subunit
MSVPDLRQARFLPVLVAVLLAGCASTNVLSVNYQLPPRAGEPLTRSVALVFADERRNDAFLTPDARKELEEFAGAYALTVSRAGQSGELLGAYPLDGLFKEVFRHRLENAGLKVAAAGAKADAEMRLMLKQFQLDFGDRKWTSIIDYEAQLLKNGTVLSRQTVNGSAERMMFIKKADAEKVISELMSDAVNKLDLSLLFKQAGL